MRVFYPAANNSIKTCPESRNYYDRKRSEGKVHSQAVLCLARRRLNVLWAMPPQHQLPTRNTARRLTISLRRTVTGSCGSVETGGVFWIAVIAAASIVVTFVLTWLSKETAGIDLDDTHVGDEMPREAVAECRPRHQRRTQQHRSAFTRTTSAT